jgi:hypothetical protein
MSASVLLTKNTGGERLIATLKVAHAPQAPCANRPLRILCVCPRLGPVNAADAHRVRLLLPHLVQQNCEVEVLAVDPADVPGPRDHWLAETLPPSVPVHTVRAWQLSGWGLNGVAQRSAYPLLKKGHELLKTGRFDVVLFSTTEFLLHVLAPLWKRRSGVPFCMDFQDPWVNDYYRKNPHIVPPGGRVKYGIVDFLSRIAERAVVRECSGFLAVSPSYVPMLAERYGDTVRSRPTLVAGFPAEPAEFERVQVLRGIRRAGATRTWRYIGRGGPDMQFSARAFFAAWKMARESAAVRPNEISLETIGTSYAAASWQIDTFWPLAREAHLESHCRETPSRIGYSAMLSALASSDALVAFGSDDSAYTASKIYPYLLARKPLLAIFHEDSSVASLMREVGGGICVTFRADTTVADLATKILCSWFVELAFERTVPLDLAKLEPYTARFQAAAVKRWLSAAINQQSAGTAQGKA